MLRIFSDSPRSLAPRELLELRDQLGGKVGVLRDGGKSIPAVQVRDGLYITTLKTGVSRALEVELNMGGSDIHPITNGADLQLFRQRLRQYDGEAPK